MSCYKDNAITYANKYGLRIEKIYPDGVDRVWYDYANLKLVTESNSP